MTVSFCKPYLTEDRDKTRETLSINKVFLLSLATLCIAPPYSVEHFISRKEKKNVYIYIYIYIYLQKYL